MHMDENNIDSKRLDDMRKSVKGKLKEREEDRNLGVKPKKSSSQKVKSELNASKGKGTQKKSKKVVQVQKNLHLKREVAL